MAGHRSYREQRYEFGRQLLMLRTRVSLTQSELAQAIGVHRRSVQNWETGESYPKADVLQRLIALFVRHNGFAVGNERAEAAALWRQAVEDGAQGLSPFDETWFAHLFTSEATSNASTSGTSSTTPISVGETSGLFPVAAMTEARSAIVDWGEAIATPTLYGRDEELKTLHQWIVDERCRVVAILGLGGIGKSSLAMTFANDAALNFDIMLFRSLQNGPLIGDLLDRIIRTVSAQPVIAPESLSEKIALLVQLFRERRCLLILDNLETILQPGALTGTYRAEYTDYGTLLRALSEREHQSCLLLTSREKPLELGPLEGRNSPVRVLRLGGLTDDACQSILEAKDIVATPTEMQELVRLYGGNPLALNLVSEPIRDLFGGDVSTFLAMGDAFFNGVSKLLEQQFARSTLLEQSLIYWLAIERELVPFNKLVANVGESMMQRDVLAALESLRRRVQIELSADRPAFTLQPVIMEYMTAQLVATICQEIVDGQFFLLQSHALMQAHAKDYVRHSQERLVLAPLLNQLSVHYGGAGPLARRLLALLDTWRGQSVIAQGYGPANVVHLLRLLRGDLRGLNLAHLALREVYWQGVEAQESSLAHAAVRDNVFTEAFGIVYSITTSASGNYWAASSINGMVQVWRNEGRTSHLSLHAHDKQIKSIAFSPDEQILATGSWDCTIKLWDTNNGALIRTLEGHSDYVQSIAFSPDGTLLASGSDDQMLRIWDIAEGTCLQTIHAHLDNVYGVSWHPDGKQVATCGFDYFLRVWDITSGDCMQTLVGHTDAVSTLAFSPDGTLLASGSYDHTVRVWDVASGESLQRFAEHTSTVIKVVWHGDGRTIVSSGYDGTIRLWDVQRSTAQRILLGHTASVTAVALIAEGSMILSGSEDQTLRVWEVASGWCVRVIEGYTLFFFCVVWSPDGRYLLSANSDTTLTIWNVEDGTARLTLRGHTHAVYAVAWSPDGRWLASGGYDQTVRIWDATTGICVRVIHQHTDLVYRMAWSPDGRWLASVGRDQTVRLWDTATGVARWVGRGHSGPLNAVVWSPDGQRLASCGEDRTVRIWRAEDGALLHILASHESSVAGVAWSPDGRLASCGGGGSFGEIFLWDAESGELVNSLVGHGSVVFRVAWSQDGKILFSGGITGTIRWWDAENGVSLQTRQSHLGWIRSLAVSPDGSMLVSSGEDGVIHLWDIKRTELIRTLRIDRPYERMEISGVRGMTDAQRAALIALGAVEQGG